MSNPVLDGQLFISLSGTTIHSVDAGTVIKDDTGKELTVEQGKVINLNGNMYMTHSDYDNFKARKEVANSIEIRPYKSEASKK